MKKILACILVGLLLFAPATGQPELDNVSKALHLGDVTNIARYFENLVEVSISNEQSTYSKTQAERVLDNFFTKNKVRDFVVKHKGNSESSNLLFLIGDLSTDKGEYRVYLMFKKKRDNSYTLAEIRIDS